jgi:glycopeptide antibiotics resistance protein
MKILFVFWKTIVWFLFMLVLFLIPSQSIPGSKEIPYLDKIVHMAFFMVFTILFTLDSLRYHRLKSIGLGLILTVFLLVLSFAVMVELLQEIMNLGREGDIVDILCDLAGYVLGLFFLFLLSLARSRSL